MTERLRPGAWWCQQQQAKTRIRPLRRQDSLRAPLLLCLSLLLLRRLLDLYYRSPILADKGFRIRVATLSVPEATVSLSLPVMHASWLSFVNTGVKKRAAMVRKKWRDRRALLSKPSCLNTLFRHFCAGEPLSPTSRVPALFISGEDNCRDNDLRARETIPTDAAKRNPACCRCCCLLASCPSAHASH